MKKNPLGSLLSFVLAGALLSGCVSTTNDNVGAGTSPAAGAPALKKVRVKVNFAPALLAKTDRLGKTLEDTVTKIEVHVTDPDTLDDLIPPQIIPYNGTPGQVIECNVPDRAGTEMLDVRAENDEGEEVGDGDLGVTDNDLFKTDETPREVTINTPNFNDGGTWIAQGPGPLFDNTGEQQQDVAGRATSVVTDPANHKIIYLGTATSGVWKSVDGGSTWKPISDDQPSLAIGAMTLADSQTLYAATGESNSNGFYGAGILKSTDAGATFSVLNPGGVFTNKAFSRILVNPTNKNVILAGVFPAVGSNFGGTYITSDDNTGPFLSKDGGATFVNAFAASFGANPGRSCTDLAITPNGATYFAAVDSSGATKANSGIYRSTDGGGTWTQLTLKDGSNNVLLANDQIGRTRFAMAPNVLYALVGDVGGDKFAGLFATTDGGNTWVKVTSTPAVEASIGGQSNYDIAVAVDPNTATTVYVGGVGPAKVSGIDLTTGSATVTALQPKVTRSDKNHAHVDYQFFETFAEGTTTTLRATTDGGLWDLTDAGAAGTNTAWTNLNGNQATGRVESLQLYGLAVNPKNPDQAFAGMQDNGSGSTSNNRRWIEPQGGDGALSRVDPTDPKVVYLASANTGSGPGLNRYSDGGVDPNNGTPITTGINLKDPAEFVTPFVIHPVQNTQLALGTNQVYETTNRGGQWTAVSGGVLAAGQTITTLAYHPKNADVLYAGLGNGQVFARFTKGGNFTGGTVPGGKRVSAIAVDPDDATGKTAYASVVQFTGPKVYKTVDGGQTWTDISQGLPDSPVMSLALDSSIKPTRLYCGTDTKGVFVRPEGAAAFTAFGTGLLPIQVTALEISGRVLSAGTYGRGMYQIPITTDQAKVTPFVIVGNPPAAAAKQVEAPVLNRAARP